MIKVYPSLMPGEPIEIHEYSGETISGWLDQQSVPFRDFEIQPVTIGVNGSTIPPEQWETFHLNLNDEVSVRVIPRGGLISGIGSLIGGIIDFFFGWLGSNAANSSETPAGVEIETSDATANAPKFGEVVPELAGRFRRYPDYLTPPRRFFETPREQVVEFHCCIGPGSYEILDENVKVGDTPFASLEGDALYEFFEPGADLTAVTTHDHWHTVSEVGGTSSGTAGLELSSVFSSEINPVAAAYLFDNNTIHIDAEAGKFPAGWGVGTVIDIRIPMSYVISTSPIDPLYNRFTGNFRELYSAILLPVSVSSSFLTGDYSVAGASLDADGNGWIELAIPGEEGALTPVGGIPDGTQTMIFYRSTRRYQVIAFSDQDVTLQAISFGAIETDWHGFPEIETEAAIIVTDPSTVYGDWTGRFSGCPAPETTTTLEVDFFFPGGLAYINDEGALEARTVTVEIQYGDANSGGPYTSVTRTYTEATLDQIGMTERIEVALMRPEVRVRRWGAAATSTQVKDTVQWYGFRTKLNTLNSYPNWTTMSVRLRSGGRLAARSENKINVIATRKLPELLSDGTWSAAQPTRDIAAFVKYIASTIGYTDANIDLDELIRVNEIWKDREDTFDFVFDQTTVKQAIDSCFKAGMAELTVADGKIRPARDEPRTVYEQGYSPQNMTEPMKRQFRGKRIEDPTAVEVEYINEANWTKEVVQCQLPGDTLVKVQKIKLDGVTDRTRAWRIGMRNRRILRYRNWEYSFSTELDAMNSEYLSFVPLIDDVPGYGQSSLILDIQPYSSGTAIVRLSEEMIWEADATHIISYRRSDGTVAGPFSASRGVDNFHVIASIPGPLPEVTMKMELPHAYFGVAERQVFPALISSVSPMGLNSVNVQATNYDVRVYADDNGTAPPYNL